MILRSENAAVDHASLIMTAREEGHIDPELGMILLLDAEEDIERNLSIVEMLMKFSKTLSICGGV